MNNSNTIDSKSSKNDFKDTNYDDRLDKIKFWKNRLRFDTGLKYIWVIAFGILLAIHLYFLHISGQEITVPIFEIIIFLTFMYGLYMETIIKGQFEDLIISSREIFTSDKNFFSYLDFVYDKFDSKTEKYHPYYFI